ncbi:MAG: hypothetical protein QOG85_2286 [Gaiellaceae bacterium]|jgi:hypothetical protein|nr:hypothetical protein [Gaiellaceae bacterium]
MRIPKLRWLVALGAALAGVAAYPALASAAVPKPVSAYYMYGTTLSSLQAGANADGCDYAGRQPNTQTDIMLVDFGAARKLASGEYGAIDFSGTTFSNASILQALESAADGYHACHARGAVIIEYGNSNYHMSDVGMTNTDVWNAGFDQALTVRALSDYQDAQGYTSQGAGAASDMEPSYDGPLITKQLVNGASAQGWAVYDDFGSVDGCPTSGTSNGPCNNGWDVSDVGYVSFHGLAVPLPEVYYAVSASQWTVVRKVWNATHTSGYFFDGTTGTIPAPSGGVTATVGWSTLNTKNPGYVGDNIVCYGSC